MILHFSYFLLCKMGVNKKRLKRCIKIKSRIRYMDSFTDLFKKQHLGELILVILFIIYLIMGYSTPKPISWYIDTIVGKIVIIVVVWFLFMYSNPILAILAVFVAFNLIYRSSGQNAYSMYSPCEDKKSDHFFAFNQFQYTLEEEIVKKMVPKFNAGSSITNAQYKPILDNNYEASPLN